MALTPAMKCPREGDVRVGFTDHVSSLPRTWRRRGHAARRAGASEPAQPGRQPSAWNQTSGSAFRQDQRSLDASPEPSEPDGTQPGRYFISASKTLHTGRDL